MNQLSHSRRQFLKGAIATLLLSGINVKVHAQNSGKPLVIYLSRTRNNKVLAEFIAQTVGGDLVEIKTQQPYPKDYQLMRSQVLNELNNEVLSPLDHSLNLQPYQQIFIVFPTWAMRLPPPIKTFLSTHNLNGKIIMPLNTNAGYGVGSGFDEIEKLASGATVYQGLSIKGGNEREGNLFVMQGATLKQAQINIQTWLQAMPIKSKPNPANTAALLTAQSTLSDLLEHPKLRLFADKILPWDGMKYDRTLPLSRISELMPYHHYFNIDDMLMPLNTMILSNEPVFYDYYGGNVHYTGLFLLRGQPNMPTAVIAAGGGFQYVGSLHEAFPLAQKIVEKGYNAVVVKYRGGVSGQWATKDLAHAVGYLFNHQQKLNIDMNHYSVWGASASARMAAYIGSYGVQRFGVHDSNIPKPQAVIMLYTGHSDVSNNETPTFAAIGESDNIASPNVMARRIQRLQQQNVKTEFHRYPNVEHGFGLGTGTSAEGWINKAADFWQKTMV